MDHFYRAIQTTTHCSVIKMSVNNIKTSLFHVNMLNDTEAAWILESTASLKR